ncbi:MAG: hypothetical protein JWN41_1654 [Thermoleophilia bacterium]|nr:hypothetical protein [Thermoleophilia bacterium]
MELSSTGARPDARLAQPATQATMQTHGSRSDGDTGTLAQFYRQSSQRNAALRDALAGGELVQDPRGALRNSGATGPPRRMIVRDATVGTIPAIAKQGVGTFPLAETFATDFGERLGIGYLFAPTVARDGGVLMEMVEGKQARHRGITSSADLQRAIEQVLRHGAPEATEQQIANRARIDRQLVQIFDYALAVPDRHARNLMVSTQRHRMTLLDHSELLGGCTPDALLAPRMMRRYLAGDHAYAPQQTVTVDADVRALVAKRMPASTVREMLATLRAHPDFRPETAGRLADPDLAATISERLHHIVTTGKLTYTYHPGLDFMGEHLGNVIDDLPALGRIISRFHH